MSQHTEFACPIDRSPMQKIFQATILGKYPAVYFRCPSCRLMQPHPPVWLAESYSAAIAKTDVGLIARNRNNWKRLEPLLHHMFPTDAKFLDVGGGYGLLCRGLRDDGYDCYTTDQYCQNLYAPDFEPGPDFKADALLAFEVMEHIANPYDFVSSAFERYGCKTLIFSTLTHQGEEIPPMDWWYYAFETGQHVSLYHQNSLQMLAKQLGVELWSLSDGLHVLSDRVPKGVSRHFLKPNRLGSVYGYYVSRSRRGLSKLQSDYETTKASVRQSQSNKKYDAE